jgi:DNA-binding transcriptional regulator YiaG
VHQFTIPELLVPTCRACGEKVFTGDVDQQVNDALRAHLKLLTPAQICDAIAALGMTQKSLAERLGIAEETLSRWITETQIQSRALDNLLRIFFAFPDVRDELCGELQDPRLGARLISDGRIPVGQTPA